MNKQEAYTKFCERINSGQSSSPWDSDAPLQSAFHAGWDACMEAQKQTELFALPEAESDKHLSCKQGEAGAIPVRSLITGKNIPPSPAEVEAYSASIGYPMNGQAWCDSYAQKGWLVGKAKMKDWKAAVRNWKVNGWRCGGPASQSQFSRSH